MILFGQKMWKVFIMTIEELYNANKEMAYTLYASYIVVMSMQSVGLLMILRMDV